MAIFRCKICGKGIAVQDDVFSCLCDYCGEQQTLPAVRDEKLTSLFNRANELRMKCEFDSAADIYKTIIQQKAKEAEAYWGLVLCKYGVEYIEGPKNHRCVPICHRVSNDLVFSDDDYLRAILYAKAEQKNFYQKEALRIDKIQREIIALAEKEPHYDVFICYKKKDGGTCTQDGIIANDIAYQLTTENLKVFYDAVTPADNAETDFEHVVFSALNSAKIMLVIGTQPEYFNAAWVRNEWSRFLTLMKKDRTRILISCYQNMDLCELPKELVHLPSKNIEDTGFTTDLLLCIHNALPTNNSVATNFPETNSISAAESAQTYSNLLNIGLIALKEKRWKDADAAFNQVLNQNPECGEAYWGKFLASQNHPDGTELSKSFAFAACDKASVKSETMEAFPADSAHIESMAEKYAIIGFYEASEIRSTYDYNRSYSSLVNGIRSRKQTMLQCVDSARMFILANKYAKDTLRQRIGQFRHNLEKSIDETIAQELQTDSANIRKLRQDYQNFLKKTDDDVIQRSNLANANREYQYQQGLQKMEKKHFSEAMSIFETLTSYKDSAQLISRCNNSKKKVRILRTILLTLIISLFIELGNYKDSSEKNKEFLENLLLQQKNAEIALVNEANDIEVTATPTALNNCKNNPTKISNCWIKLLSGAQPGDHVYFGNYEQDNDMENGAEAIEWRILAREENRLLLISEYGIDEKPYNATRSNITWEKCTLRSWLNGTFYQNAFSTEEQKQIALTNTENNVQDYIFLLSINEVENYFTDNKDRQCRITPYANINGDSNGAELWWLRSRSQSDIDHKANVYIDGSISPNGVDVTTSIAVRPALWLSLDIEEQLPLEAPIQTETFSPTETSIQTVPSAPTEATVQPPTETGQAVVAANVTQGGDFWYRDANPRSEQMGWLYNGTKVFAQGEKKIFMEEEWIKIETENRLVGWIRLSSLSFNNALSDSQELNPQ